MKKSFVQIFCAGLIVSFCIVGAERLVAADQLQQARVSQVIQDVRVLETHGGPRPAAVNDKVTQGMGVRTGVESRAELTFTDLTLTRLGANTVFSFKQGAREIELTSGAVLLQIPTKAPAVKVSTSAVTAAITGGTALFSKGPPTKFMVLEGIGTFYPIGHPERAATINGGEMMTMTADGRMTKPEKFDVKMVLKTSRLIKDFPPLENMPLVMAVVDLQLAEQQLAGLNSQALVRDLVDVIGTTDQAGAHAHRRWSVMCLRHGSEARGATEMNAQRPDLGRSEAIEIDKTDQPVSSRLTESALEARLLKRRALALLAGCLLLTLAWVGFLVWAAGKLMHEFVG